MFWFKKGGLIKNIIVIDIALKGNHLHGSHHVPMVTKFTM